MQINHRWKQAKSLQSVYNECLDIGDIDEDLLEDFRQMSLFEIVKCYFSHPRQIWA